MSMAGNQHEIFILCRPFVHDEIMGGLQVFIVCRCIKIQSQICLQRRPDICYKKFTEPVTVAAGIPLVTVSEKNRQWTIGNWQRSIISLCVFKKSKWISSLRGILFLRRFVVIDLKNYSFKYPQLLTVNCF